MFLVAHIRDEINRSVHAGSVNKGKSLEGFQNLRMLLWIKRQEHNSQIFCNIWIF
jgi:hypothetical protein